MEQNNGNSENMTINRVILLCCGKFNPPTNMHLRMFERARDHLHSLKTYAVVGGIIVPTNNLSNSNDLAHNKTRCDLMEQSLESHDWVRLSKWHVSQSNWKTLKDTVLYHQNILDSFINNDIDDNNINNKDTDWIPPSIKNKTDNKPVKIKLLGSSDLLESFSEPDFWPEEDQEKLKMIRYVSDHLSILEEFGLVIVEHVGRDLGKLVYESDILYKYLHKIHLITEWIPYDASCARIRRALQRGESVKYFVPQKVINTINEQQFFGVHNWSSKNKAIADPSVKMDKLVGRVLLMSCGSYNPPTHMHLRMFERARDHLHKLGTHVVVGGLISPVHDDYGKKDLASSKDRCEMLRLALGDSDWIRLSTWETRQKGWTRTRASLEHHQRCIDSWINQDDANSNNAPQQNKQSEQEDDLDWIPKEVRNNEPDETQEVQIKLLCGGDLLESFSKPGLWDEADIAEIVGRYGLIVITREGSNPYKFIYDSDVLSKHLHNIQIVTEWIPNEVSSTRIRRALKRGESVKYLLQDPVIDYIYSNKLYDAHKPSTM